LARFLFWLTIFLCDSIFIDVTRLGFLLSFDLTMHPISILHVLGCGYVPHCSIVSWSYPAAGVEQDRSRVVRGLRHLPRSKFWLGRPLIEAVGLPDDVPRLRAAWHLSARAHADGGVSCGLPTRIQRSPSAVLPTVCDVRRSSPAKLPIVHSTGAVSRT